MRRRKYIAAVGLAAIAGCSSTGDSNTREPEENGGSRSEQTDSDRTERTPTDESAPEATIEITDSEYRELDDTLGTVAAVATIENTGDKTYEYVETTATFRNEAGDILDTRINNMTQLPSGETWLSVMTYSQDGTAEANVEITDTIVGERYDSAEDIGLTLIEEELKPGDDISGPTVVGRVENTTGDTLEYLQSHSLFYDSQGRIRHSTFTNVTDLPDGETWRYELEFLSLLDGVEVAEYDTTFSDSAV